MKIVHLIHQFLPYGIGGSEVYTYELAQEQSKNHQVVVFSAWRNPDLPEYSLHQDCFDGIPVIRLVNNYKNVQSFQQGYDNPQIDEVFEKWIHSFKPDVVHIHHLSNLSFGMARVLKKLKIPMVMTLHDFWMVCPRGQRLRLTMETCAEIDLARCARCIQPWLEGFGYPTSDHERYLYQRYDAALETLGQMDLLIAPSLFIKKEFVHLGISPLRILFLDYGRDTKRFDNFAKSPNGGRRFGYVGTLIPSKGVHVLLEAWKDFKDQQATLDIHGAELPYDGWNDYAVQLRKRCQDDCRIRWRGNYRPEEIGNILSALDVIVAPSIWYENSPLVIQEAILTGTWVIASRIGGIPEKVVPDRNGFLFSPGNAPALLDRLQSCSSIVSQPFRVLTPVTAIKEHAGQLESWYQRILK